MRMYIAHPKLGFQHQNMHHFKILFSPFDSTRRIQTATYDLQFPLFLNSNYVYVYKYSLSQNKFNLYPLKTIPN